MIDLQSSYYVYYFLPTVSLEVFILGILSLFWYFSGKLK